MPSYTNPQSLNRYSYVTNNPLRYTDPTGHMQYEDPYEFSNGTCKSGDTSCNWVGKTKEKPRKKIKSHVGRGGGSTNTPSAISLSYDSQAFAHQYVPFTASQWGSASLFLDKAALGVDVVASSIVLGHVAVGAAGGLSFEGNPVTGGTGAAAGYIIGEMNPVVRGLVGFGNALATTATYAGLVQAEKTGDVRVTAAMNMDQSNISISAHAHISGNAAVSVGLTAAGLLAQPVSVSLPLQLLAVMNDEGSFPLPALDIGIGN